VPSGLSAAVRKASRRRLLQLAGAAAVVPLFGRSARALDYPTRPVRIIVGFAPAGPQDILARLIGEGLSERLHQPFVIENRPGAGGNVGAEAVVKSAADGYTLLLIGPPNAINASLYPKLNFDFIRDIAPVAGIARTPNILEVNLSVRATTVPELIAYAKANPGKINMGSGGVGAIQHVAGELFNFMAGVHFVHVPYRGEALALTDMLAGQVQVLFASMTSSIGFIRAGKIRPLAVTTATRSPLLPNLPTIGEFLPGYEASAWYGIGAPKDTPPEIVEKLNAAINAILDEPQMRARLADFSGEALIVTPGDFAKLIAADTEKWGKVIRIANITPN
jgi:tripartite-type tricarboxylate transporter receptor subunit TctC